MKRRSFFQAVAGAFAAIFTKPSPINYRLSELGAISKRSGSAIWKATHINYAGLVKPVRIPAPHNFYGPAIRHVLTPKDLDSPITVRYRIIK